MKSTREDKKNALLQERKNKFLKERNNRVNLNSATLFQTQASFGSFHFKATDDESDMVDKLIHASKVVHAKKRKFKNELEDLKHDKEFIKNKLRQLGSASTLRKQFVATTINLKKLIDNMDNCLIKPYLQVIINDHSKKNTELLDNLESCILENIHAQPDVNRDRSFINGMAMFLGMSLLIKPMGRLGFLLSLALMSAVTVPGLDDKEEIALNEILDVIEKIRYVSDALHLLHEKKPALMRELHAIQREINVINEKISLANQRLDDIDQRSDNLEEQEKQTHHERKHK